MRNSIICLGLILWIAGPAPAADWSAVAPSKGHDHVGHNPGTPDGREGGENMADAILITALPFNDTGNTSDNVDDWDAVCPYTGSISPDVFYRYVPAYDELIEVDLCGSGYDTKTYILDETGEVVECNDDFYFDDVCGTYVSKIEAALLQAGETYFIVIDGYGGDYGDYLLSVGPPGLIEFCELPCDGLPEGEPELHDGYVDMYNTGCNADGFDPPFQELSANWLGELIFCGYSGWYLSPSFTPYRDTDWFIIQAGDTGVVSWTLDAQEEVHGFLLGPQDCEEVDILDTITTRCDPETMTIWTEPLALLWIWVGPTEFEPPGWFTGSQFAYVSTFSGLFGGYVETTPVSMDRIKSLYR